MRVLTMLKNSKKLRRNHCNTCNLLLILLKKRYRGKSMSDDEFDAALERFMEGAQCSSYADLARFLGTGPAGVSQSRRNKKGIPSNWLITLLKKRMINPQWVLNGYPNAKYLQERPQSSEEILREFTSSYMAMA